MKRVGRKSSHVCPSGFASILLLCAPGTASRDCHSRFEWVWPMGGTPLRGEHREQVNGGVYSSAPLLSEAAFPLRMATAVSACVSLCQPQVVSDYREHNSTGTLKPQL